MSLVCGHSPDGAVGGREGRRTWGQRAGRQRRGAGLCSRGRGIFSVGRQALTHPVGRNLGASSCLEGFPSPHNPPYPSQSPGTHGPQGSLWKGTGNEWPWPGLFVHFPPLRSLMSHLNGSKPLFPQCFPLPEEHGETKEGQTVRTDSEDGQ